MHRRWLLRLTLLSIVFAFGLVVGLSWPRRELPTRNHSLWSVKELRQRIFGTNYLHLQGVVTSADTQLADFDKVETTGSITLSYVEGLGGADIHLQLHGDGTLYSELHGKRQLVTTIEQGRCKAFFRRVVTSGILNYSDGVIELKKDLERSDSITTVTDLPETLIHIVVPELKVDKSISVYAPEYEEKDFPYIIELRLVTQTEKEMLEFVPKDYPLWK